nr:hypothetical protein [Tanacetum cinerariifolium]
MEQAAILSEIVELAYSLNPSDGAYILPIFLLKDMDQDYAHMVAVSKVPMLKPENGATLRITKVVEGVTTNMLITTAKEKAQRRLEDAKKPLEAVENRFGRNVATNKTQRNLLKQQYENFTAPSSEMLDQNFDRLQKLVSQLELLEEKISQEDVNQNLLRSLSPEWNTHEGSLLLMAMKLLVLISPKWSATTATRGDILLGSAELQKIKTTSTRKAQEGVKKKGQIMHSWLYHLQVLTKRVPRKTNMYSVDLKNIVPKGGLTCLFVKATSDGSKFSNRRLGDLNFKTMNKLVKENLVRDHLGKFDGKADEDFFVGYSLNSKAFRVFNNRTRIVKENLHIRFSESTPNVVGQARKEIKPVKDYILLPLWTADLPFFQDPKSSNDDGSKPSSDDGKKVDKDPRKENECQARKEIKPVKDYILLPLWTADLPFFQDPKSSNDDGSKPSSDDGKKVDKDPRKENECNDQEKEDNVNNTNNVNTVNVSTFDFSSDDEDDGVVADMNNLDTTIQVSPIPTTRIHKDHPLDQVIEDLQLATQTRKMSKNLKEHGFLSTIQQRTNHKDHQHCLFACFLSQEEPKKIIHALKDPSWIEAIQEELLRFKLQETEKEVYICQPPGFKDPNFPGRVYKVKKALYGLHKALRAWYETLSTYLLDNGFQRGKIDKTLFIKGTKMSYMGELTFFLGLQVKQKQDGIFISQDKYVAEILKKFRFTEVKSASTPMETQKPLLKDEDGKEVDVHMYSSIISSLMYLTSSRPDIMFAVCACARNQVNPKVSHLYAMKRIFSDYAGASLDRKSTIGGCQILGCRLISWQCKKQTMVSNSTTKTEYVAASSCCGQMLWI